MQKPLPPQSWTQEANTLAVIRALEAAGGAGSARFVGGCVRDALLARPIGDIDIATTLEPPEVIRALEAAGLAFVPTGLDHGTVTALSGGRPFEITSLRRDVATDGRRAVVAFTTDWAEDARRRDFTLNAIYMAPTGDIFDSTGRGVEDARAGRIVFVGEPQDRIAEDFLRILRFFRFTAWYGKGTPDAEALAACAAGRLGLRSLSAERVSKELMRLLEAPDPRDALRLMRAAGVLDVILPEGRNEARFNALVGIETDHLYTVDAPLRLAALLPQDPEAAAAACRRLRLPRAVEARVSQAVATDERIVSWMSPREMRRSIYRLGNAVFKDRMSLAWAASDRPAAFVQWRMMYAYVDAWRPPQLPLSGEEILAAGVPPGPLVGLVRREVESFWIDLDFTDDKLALLERLKAVAQGLAY